MAPLTMAMLAVATLLVFTHSHYGVRSGACMPCLHRMHAVAYAILTVHAISGHHSTHSIHATHATHSTRSTVYLLGGLSTDRHRVTRQDLRLLRPRVQLVECTLLRATHPR